MPNKQYLAGRVKEWKTIALLEELDYVCFRMAGSHTCADVIAFPPLPTSPLWIQCKSSQRFDTAEWNILYEWATRYNSIPLLAICENRRPIVFYELTGVKVARSKFRPWIEWTP